MDEFMIGCDSKEKIYRNGWLDYACYTQEHWWNEDLADLSEQCIPSPNKTIYKLNHWERFPYHYDLYLYGSNATSFVQVNAVMEAAVQRELEMRKNMSQYCGHAVHLSNQTQRDFDIFVPISALLCLIVTATALRFLKKYFVKSKRVLGYGQY